MILSLAVILLPILLILGAWRWLSSGNDVSVVDPGPAYVEAADAGLPVLRPEGLGADWRPTSSNVIRENGAVTLRVGYVTPDDAGVQLVESSAESADLLAGELGMGPRSEGTVDVGGTAWLVYATEDGNAALVWSQDALTVIVIGAAQRDELAELAGALR